MISSVQFGVLAVLARRPGASQQDLCDEVDLDRSTIADIVRRLETRELIRRRRDAADRRRNQLVLTDHGERVLRDLLPRVEGVEHVLTDALTADERDELRRLLRKVLRSSGGALKWTTARRTRSAATSDLTRRAPSQPLRRGRGYLSVGCQHVPRCSPDPPGDDVGGPAAHDERRARDGVRLQDAVRPIPVDRLEHDVTVAVRALATPYRARGPRAAGRAARRGSRATLPPLSRSTAWIQTSRVRIHTVSRRRHDAALRGAHLARPTRRRAGRATRRSGARPRARTGCAAPRPAASRRTRSPRRAASAEAYIGVSTPVRAHSIRRARARALKPTCAMRCRRVQPGSERRRVELVVAQLVELAGPVRLSRGASAAATRASCGSVIWSVRAATSDLRDDVVAQLAEPGDRRR